MKYTSDNITNYLWCTTASSDLTSKENTDNPITTRWIIRGLLGGFNNAVTLNGPKSHPFLSSQGFVERKTTELWS